MTDITPDAIDALRDIREGICAFLRQYGESTVDSSAGVVPDGPLEQAYAFGWGNVRYDGLKKKGWLLLHALWIAPERAMVSSALAGPVWEDPGGVITKDQAHGVRKGVNKFFSTHGIPWRVHVREGRDTNNQGHELLVSLEYEEPASQKRPPEDRQPTQNAKPTRVE